MKKEVFPLANKKNTEKRKKKISRTGFAWSLYLLGSNLLKMVWLSVVVTVCCCTVVLAPAAVTGGCRSLLMLLRGRGGLFWDDFKEDFTDRFLKKLGYWLMMVLIPVAVGLWMYILGAKAETVRWVILGLSLVSAVLQAYFFVMVACVDLSLDKCLKNGALLLFLEWKTTLVFLVCFGAAAASVYLLFPYSIPVLCFLGFSCMMLLVTQQVRRIILRRGICVEPTWQNETENGGEDAAEEGAK